MVPEAVPRSRVTRSRSAPRTTAVPWTLAVLTACLVAVAALLPGPASAARGEPTARYAFPGPGTRADDGARVVEVKPLGERTADLVIESPAMGTKLPVRVILPHSWTSQPRRAFPTLYLLQGASDDYTSWTRETDVHELSKGSEALIVTPEGGRAGFYTNWYNNGRRGTPRWETFHTVELPQILERGWRANQRRALIGVSEGGLGALNYAARHQGAYLYTASFSGITDLDDRYLRTAVRLTCLREGVDSERLWGHPWRQQHVWDAHNPSYRIERFRGVRVHVSAATGLPGEYEDEDDINVGGGMLEGPTFKPTRRFAQELREVGVDVTSNLYLTGTHSWPYWERELHTVWSDVLATLQAAP
ncbi:alpha/beta hydrolase [Streptomyces pathocidini]|uniref:Alpha/beta hydrolase n=2 Tax=Streptomyces pathocidini TaxID=1650571 RepID=A0ABW7UN42_9ACTN